MGDENMFDEIMKEWGKLSREIDIFPNLNCLSSIQIIGYVENSLGDEEKQQIQEHLAHCNYCVLEVAELFRAKAQYEVTRISYIKWWELSKEEVKKLITEAVDRFRAVVSQLFPATSEFEAVGADEAKKLDVLVFDEHGGEKEISFTVESGPEVDEEGQLKLRLIAPEASYEGEEMTLALKLDEKKQLVLASPPIIGGEASIILDMGLEPELKIPLEMIVVTIEKKD